MSDTPKSAAQRLTELMLVGEEALLYVHRLRKRINGAVNWADLNVVDAQYVVSVDRSEPYFRIVIDEVSPEAAEFQTAIAKYLSDHGWPNVEVETEW